MPESGFEQEWVNRENCDVEFRMTNLHRCSMLALVVTLIAVATTPRNDCHGYQNIGDENLRGDSVAWKTGEAFRSRLEGSVGIQWRSNPLRSAVRNLATTQEIAVFLDRHIDPTQEIDFTANNESLRSVFDRLGAQINAGVSYVNSVVYIGPPNVTKKLATVAAMRREDQERLSGATRTRLQKTTAWKWKQLATPKDLIADLEREYKVKFTNADVLPHDLWAAGNLPPLSFADRLSIVAAGFGKTFELDAKGETVMLVPIPDEVSIRKIYQAKGDVESIVNNWNEKSQGSTLTRKGDRLELVGIWEEHETLQRQLKGDSAPRTTSSSNSTAAGKSGTTTKPNPSSPSSSPALTRYTLTIQNQPIGGVLKALAERIMLDLHIDDDATSLMQKRVSFQVKNATMDELFRAATDPAGLAFEVNDKQLVIRKGK